MSRIDDAIDKTKSEMEFVGKYHSHYPLWEVILTILEEIREIKTMLQKDGDASQ